MAGDVAAHVVVADVLAPALSDEDAHHLRAVLRLRPGARVGVTDGRGGYVLCRLAGGSSLGLEAAGPVAFSSRPVPSLTVAFAPVKGDRPEWAVQKLTELGVDNIVLTQCARSVVRWDPDRAASNVARLQKVARQAVMQSRQVWEPSVTGVVPFESLVSLGGPEAGSGVALCAPDGAPPSLDHPTLLVGPEGGWDPAELAAGPPLVRLGPTVLRAETAAVVAGSLLVALRSGLVGRAPSDWGV